MSQPGTAGGVTGLWRRLLRSNDELAAQERQRAAAEHGARMTVGQCCDRDVVTLVGTLAVVTINPASDKRWLEVDLDDGTGRVRLVWMGRSRIRGIDAGRRLRVEGRMSYVDGRRTIYNPRYELLP